MRNHDLVNNAGNLEWIGLPVPKNGTAPYLQSSEMPPNCRLTKHFGILVEAKHHASETKVKRRVEVIDSQVKEHLCA